MFKEVLNRNFESEAVKFRDGVIETFEPRFDSVSKDCDRYSDALTALVESGSLDRKEYFELSGTGSLWISFKYIESGLLDAVESDLIRSESSRDIFGALHQNTQLTLQRLIEVGAFERVMNTYRSAIEHRVRALKSELAMQEKSRKGGQMATSGWIEHYLPPLRNMVKEYGELLHRLNLTDPNLETYRSAIKTAVE